MERVWTVWWCAPGKASSSRLVFQIEPKEGPASGGTQVHALAPSTVYASPLNTSHAPCSSPAASTPAREQPGVERGAAQACAWLTAAVPNRRGGLASQVTITVNTQVPDGPKNIHCAFGEKVRSHVQRLLVCPPLDRRCLSSNPTATRRAAPPHTRSPTRGLALASATVVLRTMLVRTCSCVRAARETMMHSDGGP